MNSPAPSQTPPAPVCPPAYIGPCTGCGHPTHRYGPGGCPLCDICMAGVEAGRAKASGA